MSEVETNSAKFRFDSTQFAATLLGGFLPIPKGETTQYDRRQHPSPQRSQIPRDGCGVLHQTLAAVVEAH